MTKKYILDFLKEHKYKQNTLKLLETLNGKYNAR